MIFLRLSFAFIATLFMTEAAPLIESYREIEIPTGIDELEGIIDLGRLSNGELAALEQALQSRIKAYEAERDRGFVEDAVPIALTETDLRHLVRDRRGGARQSAVPVLDDDGDVQLVPINGYEEPIIVFDETEVPFEEVIDDGHGSFVDDEPENVVLAPVRRVQPEAVYVLNRPPGLQLTEDNIDEFELRQRLADLGNALGERAFRGL